MFHVFVVFSVNSKTADKCCEVQSALVKWKQVKFKLLCEFVYCQLQTD